MLRIKMKNILAAVVLSGLLVLVSCLHSNGIPSSPVTDKQEAEMVLIPAGQYYMGQDDDWDGTQHLLHIDAFYIDRHEVTNSLYHAFCMETGHRLPEFWGMDAFRSGPRFPDHPVVGVSYRDAEAYAEWAGKRLPTEAEWEYAARGGLDRKKFVYGDTLDPSMGNYWNSGNENGLKPVGSYTANGYGLHDMLGNVSEWVADYYDRDYYSVSPPENPKGPETGKFRVIRGGGWHTGPGCARVTYRNALLAGWVDFSVGFRCAKDHEPR